LLPLRNQNLKEEKTTSFFANYTTRNDFYKNFFGRFAGIFQIPQLSLRFAYEIADFGVIYYHPGSKKQVFCKNSGSNIFIFDRFLMPINPLHCGISG